MTLKTIVLVRHAESLEDIDPTLHNISDDKSVMLTDHGKFQAREIGERLKREIFSTHNVKVFLSPSHRALETWRIICDTINPQSVPVVDRRIKNLNWGNITLATRVQIEAERYRAGVLYYQFPRGDNTPKYVSSIGAFVAEMLYDKEKEDYPQHVLVVTHGFALRVIVKFLLSISDEDFRSLRNPPNGYVLRIEYADGRFFPTSELLRVVH